MPSLEKRIAALEPATGGTVYQLTDSQLMDVIDGSFIKSGTTMAEQVAKHGSLQAVLVAAVQRRTDDDSI